MERDRRDFRELVLALALAAAIGALLFWSLAEHAERTSGGGRPGDRTETRGLKDDGSSE